MGPNEVGRGDLHWECIMKQFACPYRNGIKFISRLVRIAWNFSPPYTRQELRYIRRFGALRVLTVRLEVSTVHPEVLHIMGSYKIMTGLFVTLAFYLILVHKQPLASAAPSSNLESGHRVRSRPFLRFPPRAGGQYARVKTEGLGEFTGKENYYTNIIFSDLFNRKNLHNLLFKIFL